jgi:hypothetical protein
MLLSLDKFLTSPCFMIILQLYMFRVIEEAVGGPTFKALSESQSQ